MGAAGRGRRAADRAAPDGDICVTFLWRDPHGGAAASPLVQVYADVNSVTDHHRPQPQSLARLGDTDIWWWQATLPANWRGSYTYIPVSAAQTPPRPDADARASRLRHREWWLDIMSRAAPDPLNPRAGYVSSWGAPLSALHLEAAPEQSAWHAWDQGRQGADPARLTRIHWDSARLGKKRRIWIYQTGALPEGERGERPLAILLDGQYWAERMPVFAALDEDTRRGRRRRRCIYWWMSSTAGIASRTCPAMPTSGWPCSKNCCRRRAAGPVQRAAGTHRGGGPELWRPGGDVRRPALAAALRLRAQPVRLLLVALRGTARTRARRQRTALAQRPRPADRTTGGRRIAAGRLRVYQEVGRREEVMLDVNASQRAALERAGHCVRYQEFEGGHDWLCWRGGLLDGLAWLWEDGSREGNPRPMPADSGIMPFLGR